MGLLHAWQYFDYNGTEYWLLELKKRVHIDNSEGTDNLVFYNCAKDEWSFLKRDFPIDENCHRVTYEQLRQQWQKYWNNSGTPFSLITAVVEKELAVWIYYPPINHPTAHQEFGQDRLTYISQKHLPALPRVDTPYRLKPHKRFEMLSAFHLPQSFEVPKRFTETLVWIFHLKRPIAAIRQNPNGAETVDPVATWVALIITNEQKKWLSIDVGEWPINDQTCGRVPFERLEVEFQRMFTRQEHLPAFTIEDIVER